jgi:MFS family permease
VVASPISGPSLDRGARRPFITYGALVNALAGAAFALVHAVSAPMYLLRAVHGISYALVFNAIVTLAADLAPPKRLGQAIGLTGAAGMMANAVAPALAESVADARGWPLVFLLAGACALSAALLSLAIREPAPQPAPAGSFVSVSASASGPRPTPSAFALVRDPQRLGAFVCCVANGAAYGVMFTFTQPFALAHGANRVSGFFIGYTLSALAIRLFFGNLADAWGRRRVAFWALALYGVVTCMTSQLRPDLLFVVGASLGLAHGFLYPALNALAAEGVPRSRRGAVMSYFFSCFNGGFALWVLGLGVVAKSYGYPIVFLATGLLVWLSMAFLPKQRPTPGAIA